MKKLWLRDIKFLYKNLESNQNKNEMLQILNKIESAKVENADYFLFNLNENETELIEDFLTDLISEIGIGEDGEINSTGRYIDDLIDVFNTRDSK